MPQEQRASTAAPAPAEERASPTVPAPAEERASPTVPAPAEERASPTVPAPAEARASASLPAPAEERASPTVPPPTEEPAKATRVSDEEAADTTSRTVLRATPPQAAPPRPPAPPPRTTTRRPRDLPPTPAATDEQFAQRRRVAVMAAAGLLVLALVGFLLGRMGGDAAPTRAPVGPTSTASNSDVVLALPAGWRRTDEAPPVDLGLADAMTLAGPGGGLVVGRVERPGAGLLPQALAESAEPKPGIGDPVRTANLQGYRYEALQVPGTIATHLDVLTVPTSSGALAFACTFTNPTEPAREACRGVVDSARLVRGKPAPVGTDPAYAGKLNAALDGLNAKVRSGRRALRSARTPRGQGQIAGALARSYAQAAASVRDAEPGVLAGDANGDIARGLDQTSDAYKRLASAARSGSRPAYRRARTAVSRAERATAAALAELEKLGYGRPPS